MSWRCAAMMVSLAGVGPAVAQSPIVITSQVETGWTSNATDSAAGGADFYTGHSHAVTLAGATDNFVLRGSLAMSQTRFMQTAFENDDDVSGSIEVELALGEVAVLRLGYEVERSWTGDDLSIGGLQVPIRTDEIEHSYGAELVVAGPEQQVTVGVDAAWALPGDTTLIGFGLPALRLAPEVRSVALRLAWERALTPTVAALAGMEAWLTSIPAEQQLTFVRLPVDGGRVAVGLRMVHGILSLEGSGGFDMVWPKYGVLSPVTSPYVSLAASLVPTPELTLALGAQTGVELADPLDGAAGRTVSLEIGAAWNIRPDLTLSTKLSDWRETGIFVPEIGQSRRVASLGLNFAASDRLAYGATLSWSRHDDPAESYDKTRISLSLSGAI